MSILAIALTIVLIGLVVWFLTPSGKAEIVKVETALKVREARINDSITKAEAEAKAEAAKVEGAAKADVQSAVADVRKRLP